MTTVSLIACAIAVGCAASTRANVGDPPRYLALGDSYTIGERVDSASRWPVQLARALRAKGVAMGDPQIIARTGWTTDELSAAIDRERPSGPYELVSLLIGVNNQYRGRSAVQYESDITALLDRAIALAGGRPAHVLVLSIPDWGVTPFAAGRDRAKIGAEIDAFNEVARQRSRVRGVRFVDITPGSRRADTDPSLVAPDGLHPSAKMYAEWTAAALRALDGAGQESPSNPISRRGERSEPISHVYLPMLS
ncbi:MAG: SGNH/GDSL hydrolase family protein [Gemmatimonadaceae bacterium]